ncbi:hypothetical protein D3C77_716830 [compost metagenome]
MLAQGCGVCVPLRQQLARLGNGLPLQMTTADRPHHLIGEHRHPGPLLTGHGATSGLYLHPAQRLLRQTVQDSLLCFTPHDRTPIALMTDVHAFCESQ